MRMLVAVLFGFVLGVLAAEMRRRRQRSTARYFNFANPDFDASPWTVAPYAPDAWPDTDASWIWDTDGFPTEVTPAFYIDADDGVSEHWDIQ